MRHKLIIDGNAVYEIDDDCLRCMEEREKGRRDKRRGYTDPDRGEKDAAERIRDE